MRIKLHNRHRRHVTWVQADSKKLPSVVHAPNPDGPEVEYYLDWDRAFDDEGHLRKCPACGCEDVYRRSAAPPLTGFVLVLVVGLICLVLWGLADAPLSLVIGALVLVVIANVIVIIVAPRHMACYQCGSSYFGVPVSRRQNEWDAATAEKYRKVPEPSTAQSETSATESR